jgi:hypothetical protein
MESILGAILSQIDENSLQVISRQANASPAQTQNAIASAIPILMNALAKNNQTTDGAKALQNAIRRDHNGSILDNLGAVLNTPNLDDGAGILRHVLGNRQ